ncbi:MAG: oligosaccharide flippase family protein [Acutalibacteraceae bacterium]|nr:oligosaccharide flippase family protein [Acutalibacteraceae bacterium]
MNKYSALAKNTVIFAIGTFSSKILSFIMVFFYSRAMQTAEFGMLDILINSAALMLPLAMLGITNAIIRFGLDDENKKSDVFTSGLIAVGIGFGVLIVVSPAIMLIDDLKNYIVLLYAYVLMSALRHICSFFVRANNQPKLFAIDGVFSTFMTCILTLIFLIPLKMGIVGYMLAIILADLSSVIFLSINGRLWSFVNFKGLNKRLTGTMIKFSLPLMPTSLLWWVVNVSDRYFVKYMLGDSANGLYAAAYKVPTILTLVATIFLDAWQISAVTEHKSEERNSFYSNIFKTFQGGVFVVGSLLIITAKLVTKILLAESYYDSWQYIPVLIFATVFISFVTFLGNIYLAEKKNVATLLTTLVGAVLNLILNYFLIKQMGAQGAAVATLISYVAVFIIRAVDIKIRNRDISFATFIVIINSLIMLAQVYLMLLEPNNWLIYQLICVALLIVVNVKNLLLLVKKVLKR